MTAPPGRCAGGKSLLPAGVVAVEGAFERGDASIVRTRAGGEVGRGLSAYASADIAPIAGHKSGEIAAILGYRGRDEIIHRDDLVVTEPAMTTDDDAARSRDEIASGDLAATMAAIGRRAREAAAALALAPAEAQDEALRRAAAAVRAQANEILAANADDLAAARRSGIGAGVARPARARPEAARSDRQGTRGHRRAARPGRPRARRMDAAERAQYLARQRAARRHRHHLREPPERDRRCRRAGAQIRQCRDPARRLREFSFLARAGRGVARGVARRRPAGGRDPARADPRPRGGRA